jgi:hypothetical protein
MKYVNQNPVNPMSGHAPAAAPPAVTTVSPILSRDIARAVGVVSRGERHAMSCGLPHDHTEVSCLAESAAAAVAAHPTRGDAPEAPTPKRGSLPYATPDAPNSTVGTAPGSSVAPSILSRDAADALRARGVKP